MRKILLSTLTLLLLTVAFLVMKNGIHIGPLQIQGFQGLKDEDSQLTQLISDAGVKKDEYKSRVSSLSTSVEALQKAKKEYTDLINISSESDIKEALQSRTYSLEYLWSRIGYLATQLGVTIKMNVSTSSSSNDAEYKNLSFEVNGKYLRIEEFVRKLEDDSEFNFTIKDFKMKSNFCSFKVNNVKVKNEKIADNSNS